MLCDQRKSSCCVSVERYLQKDAFPRRSIKQNSVCVASYSLVRRKRELLGLQVADHRYLLRCQMRVSGTDFFQVVATSQGDPNWPLERDDFVPSYIDLSQDFLLLLPF